MNDKTAEGNDMQRSEARRGAVRSGRRAYELRSAGLPLESPSRASGQAERSPDSTYEEDYIYGRNSVLAFLEAAGKPASINADSSGQLDKIFLAQGLSGPDKRIDQIKKLAKEHTVPVMICTKQQLERLVGTDCRHQGIVARLSQGKTISLSEFLEQIEKENTPANPENQAAKDILLAVVDGIQDPHNLGAVIRVAHAAGAKGLITTIRRTAGTTAAVSRASAGALARLPIVRVQNLVSAIDELKKHGFWIAGLDAKASESVFSHDLRLPLAVVIGGEGKGLGRLVTEHCDFLLSIPMSPDSESLNASVAAGIVFYEYVRQNLNDNKKQ